LSFLIIGLGGLSCVLGGFISQKIGVKKTAFIALLLSGICCIISPLIFYTNSPFIMVAFLMFWGLVVIADSPLFSTLVAQNAKAEVKGTALTIVNCIGFAITILSIQIINLFIQFWTPKYVFTLLAIGPLFGLIALYKNKKLN
jgi:MFS family permease